MSRKPKDDARDANVRKLQDMLARVDTLMDTLAREHEQIKHLREQLAALDEPTEPRAPAKPKTTRAAAPRAAARKAKPAPAKPTKERAPPKKARSKPKTSPAGPGAMRSLQRAQKRLEELGVKPYKAKQAPSRK